MVVMSEDFGDVALHGYAESEFGAVPVEVYAGKLGAFPVLGDGVYCWRMSLRCRAWR